MSTVDIIILLAFTPAVWRGITKGFIEQAVALISLILGAWLAYNFSEPVCEWLKPYIEVSETVLCVISYGVIVMAVVIALFVAGKMLTGLVRLVLLGWLDRILGLAFALLQSALLIGLIIILFDTINVKFELVSTEVLDASVLYSPIKDAAYIIFPYLKQLLFKQ